MVGVNSRWEEKANTEIHDQHVQIIVHLFGSVVNVSGNIQCCELFSFFFIRSLFLGTQILQTYEVCLRMFVTCLIIGTSVYARVTNTVLRELHYVYVT